MTVKRRLACGLIEAFLYLKGACNQEGEQLFTLGDSDRTRGNNFRLRELIFRLYIKGNFSLRGW